MRNFGIMSEPVSLSGASSTDRPASLGSYAPSDSILFRDIPPLERSEITQSLIDVGAVFFAFMFVSLLALAIVGAIGILFLV